MRDRAGILMPSSTQDARTRLVFAFVSAVVALIVAFAAVGSTIPLFNL
jgi:hypothetical protein